MYVRRTTPAERSGPRLRDRDSRCRTAGRYADNLCKLGRLESVEVAEQQQRSLVRVEMAFEEVPERHHLLGLVRTFERSWEASEGNTETPPAAQGTQGTVSRDPEEPGLRVRRRQELRARAERVVEAVLKKILGKAAIPDHLNEEPSNRALAAREQRLDY